MASALVVLTVVAKSATVMAKTAVDVSLVTVAVVAVGAGGGIVSSCSSSSSGGSSII